MSDFFLDVSFETPISIYIVFGYVCQGKFAHFKRFTGEITPIKLIFRPDQSWLELSVMELSLTEFPLTVLSFREDVFWLTEFPLTVPSGSRSGKE